MPSPTEHSLSHQFSLLIMTGNQSLLVLELPITISSVVSDLASDRLVEQSSYIYRPQQITRPSLQLPESLQKPADWRPNKSQFWLKSLAWLSSHMERTPSLPAQHNAKVFGESVTVPHYQSNHRMISTEYAQDNRFCAYNPKYEDLAAHWPQTRAPCVIPAVMTAGYLNLVIAHPPTS